MTFIIRNKSGNLFSGWFRTVIDAATAPKVDRGITLDGRRWALGDNPTLSSRIFDIELKLPINGDFIVTSDTLIGAPWKDADLPKDVLNYIGVPTIGGVPLQLVISSLRMNGAHYEATFQGRVSPMEFDRVHLRWVPGQDVAHGVRTMTFSNASLPDLRAQFAPDILKFGPRAAEEEPYPNWDYVGDGQMCTVNFGIVFGDKQDGFEAEAEAANALAYKRIVGHGLTRIGYLPPAAQGRFNPATFTARYLEASRDSIIDWGITDIGIMARSENSGDQETQGYQQGHESLYPGGTGSELVRYYTALGYGRQPCHHLESSGAVVTPQGHPRLVLWAGRPHWHLGVSPDQLNKPRQQDGADTHGWSGPDRQHVWVHDLAAAWETTACPAIQDMLVHRAWNYLLEDTTDPSLSTSGSDEPRSAGWRGLMVAHLYRCLRDRELADRVKQRWIDRVEKVYVPAWGYKDVWATYETNQTDAMDMVAFPRKAFWYQQAVSAFGLWVASSLFNHGPGIDLALKGAEAVFLYGYKDGVEWEVTGIRADGTPTDTPYENGRNARRLGWYRYKWMPLCLPVVIWRSHSEAISGHAKQYYDMLLKEYVGSVESSQTPADWFAPLSMSPSL